MLQRTNNFLLAVFIAVLFHIGLFLNIQFSLKTRSENHHPKMSFLGGFFSKYDFQLHKIDESTEVDLDWSIHNKLFSQLNDQKGVVILGKSKEFYPSEKTTMKKTFESGYKNEDSLFSLDDLGLEDGEYESLKMVPKEEGRFQSFGL